MTHSWRITFPFPLYTLRCYTSIRGRPSGLILYLQNLKTLVWLSGNQNFFHPLSFFRTQWALLDRDYIWDIGATLYIMNRYYLCTPWVFSSSSVQIYVFSSPSGPQWGSRRWVSAAVFLSPHDKEPSADTFGHLEKENDGYLMCGVVWGITLHANHHIL